MLLHLWHSIRPPTRVVLDVIAWADEWDDHQPCGHRVFELLQRDLIRFNLRLHADEHYAQAHRVRLTPLFLATAGVSSYDQLVATRSGLLVNVGNDFRNLRGNGLHAFRLLLARTLGLNELHLNRLPYIFTHVLELEFTRVFPLSVYEHHAAEEIMKLSEVLFDLLHLPLR